MVGEKDRDLEGPGHETGARESDTTTWRGGRAAPRVPVAPSPRVDSDDRGVSQSAETVVTESGAAMPSNMDMSVTADGRLVAAPFAFERIEPSSMRGDRIRLDPGLARIRVGRAETNEFRLYSAATSRKHAVIERNFTGDWVLTPFAGKSLKIDGHPTSEPVILEAGMNLVLGGDHLRCLLDESASSDGFDEPSDRGYEAPVFAWERLSESKWMLGLGSTILFGVALGVLLWLAN